MIWRIVAFCSALLEHVKTFVKSALGDEGEEICIAGTNLRLGSKIAEGGYSVIHVGYSVIKGSRRRTGRRFAVKKLLCHDQESLQAALEEASLLNTLPPHPSVVRFFGSLQRQPRRGGGGAGGERSEVLLLTEYCSGGALSAALGEARERGSEIPTRGLLVIFQQVARAVQHLHAQSPPIAHRDLKMENVLLTGSLASSLAASSRVLLCDFGSASTRAQVYESRKEIVEEEERIQAKTTVAYRAPEMVDLYQKKRVDHMVDVWALGVLLYTMCFNRFPFDPQFQLGILNGQYSVPTALDRREEDKVVRDIIAACLQVDPAARPTVQRLLQMTEGLELPRVASLAGAGGEDWEDLKGDDAV